MKTRDALVIYLLLDKKAAKYTFKCSTQILKTETSNHTYKILKNTKNIHIYVVKSHNKLEAGVL